MKIFGNNMLPSSLVDQVKGKNKVSPARLPSDIRVHRDRVQLSPAAMEISRAKKELEAIPEVREEKVAEIRARIENGAYTMNREKIASKIIEEALLNDLA